MCKICSSQVSIPTEELIALLEEAFKFHPWEYEQAKRTPAERRFYYAKLVRG